MEENQNIEITEQTSTVIETTPSEEQRKFSEMVAQMAELNLEVDDVVIFRNNALGRISTIQISELSMIYRIYVKVGDSIITLNEEFKNLSDNIGYDVKKIMSHDFTNEKVEIELNEVIISKTEAQRQLSEVTGKNIIIE